MATRSIPIPKTDAESDSGITWPPEEKLELLWFEKSPPPADVAENFHIVPLDEIGAHAGTPVESLEPGVDKAPAAPVEPLGTVDEFERLSRTLRAPINAAGTIHPAAGTVQPWEEVEPVIAVQRAAAPRRVDGTAWALATVLAVTAFGLLLLIVGVWWRWSPSSEKLAQASPAAVAAAEVTPPPRPSVAAPAPLPVPAAAEPESVPPVKEARPTVKARARAKPKPPSRSAAKPNRKQVKATASTTRVAKSAPAPRPSSVVREADTPPPPPIPAPEATVASMPAQPLAAQPTIGAPAHIEEPPAHSAPRVPTTTPAHAPAPSNARTASVATAPSDEQRIRTVLSNYQSAFEQFDPNAVQAVWPSVDKRALSRAFDGLSSQNIVFDRCDVSVTAGTARAACNGGVQYVKRVGGGSTQSAKRQWVFDLQKSPDGGWQIRSLSSH